jgi:hypothetical protein
VIRPDVRPGAEGQLDAPSVGVERRCEHAAIVSARPAARNWPK